MAIWCVGEGRARTHIVEDVDRCVQSLGDEEEIVEHDARPGEG